MVVASGSLVTMMMAAAWTGLYLSSRPGQNGSPVIKGPVKMTDTYSPNSLIVHHPRSVKNEEDTAKNKVESLDVNYDYGSSEELRDMNQWLSYSDKNKDVNSNRVPTDVVPSDSTVDIVLLKRNAREHREQQINSGS